MKKESFAQVKGKDKGKGKNTKISHNANMGFAQPAEITKMSIEEINKCIEDNDPRMNIIPITGVQDDDETIEEIEICTQDMIDEMKDYHTDEALALIVKTHNQLINESSSDLSEEAWLNKCLYCGGWPGSVHTSDPNRKLCQWGYKEDSEEEVSIVDSQGQDYCFASSHTGMSDQPIILKESDEKYDDESLTGTSDEFNIINGQYTECFTMGMIKKMSKQLSIDVSKLLIEESVEEYREVWLTECLVCGGRGFYGKLCRKCNHGTYNLGIGICMPCGCLGVLGTDCSYCGIRPFTNLKIMCTNPKIGNVFTCEQESHNEFWYNAIQRSFYDFQKLKNVVWRFRNQESLKEEYVIDKAIKPDKHIENWNAFRDLKDVNNTIQTMYNDMNPDRKPEPLTKKQLEIKEAWVNGDYEAPKKPELVEGTPPSHNTSSSKFMKNIKKHENYIKSQKMCKMASLVHMKEDFKDDTDFEATYLQTRKKSGDEDIKIAAKVSEEVYEPRVSVLSKKTCISTKSSME